MENTIDKAALIEKTRAGYAELEALLAPLGEAQMIEAAPDGGWSVKDHLAHLAFWQHWLVRLLKAAQDGRTPGHPTGMTDADIDRLNEEGVSASHGQTLAQVLADFRGSFEQVLVLLNLLSDDALTERQRFEWMRGSPLAESVAGNTYEHYVEHGATIQALLRDRER